MIVEYVLDPDRKDILCVTADGEPVCDVHAKIFRSQSSLPKYVESLEGLHLAIEAFEIKKARNMLINKLAKKNAPSFELRAFLQQYLISEGVIDTLIDEFQQTGYIDDEAWLEAFVRTTTAQKKGPAAIEQKLWQKKAPKALIEKALSLVNDDESQQEQIMALLKTKYRRRNLEDYKERSKVVASLVRRGFDANLVREAVLESTKSGELSDWSFAENHS